MYKRQVFSIRDLVNERMEVVEGTEIRSKDVIPFVVLQWDSSKDTNWTVPEPQLFHDLVNRVESRVMELGLKCGDVLKWSNMWGKVGLLGLSARDRDMITSFRELIEKQVTGTIKFSIYPRDALEKKGNVWTTALKELVWKASTTSILQKFLVVCRSGLG